MLHFLYESITKDINLRNLYNDYKHRLALSGLDARLYQNVVRTLSHPKVCRFIQNTHQLLLKMP